MIEGMVINFTWVVAYVLVIAGATSSCASTQLVCSSQAAKASDSQPADLGFPRLLHFASRIGLLDRVEISIRRSCAMAWFS